MFWRFFTKWLVDISGGGLGWETSYAHRWGQRLRTGDVMASRRWSEKGDTEKKALGDYLTKGCSGKVILAIGNFGKFWAFWLFCGA